MGRGPELSPLPPSEGACHISCPAPLTPNCRSKKFPNTGVGHQRRQRACRVSLLPTRRLSSCDSRWSFQIACFIGINSTCPARGLPWDHRPASWLISQPSLFRFLRWVQLFLVVWALREGRLRTGPILLGLGLGAGWSRFSRPSLTLGPYKIGCPQPHYFNKSGAILI